jgi:hypothetical protein
MIVVIVSSREQFLLQIVVAAVLPQQIQLIMAEL